MRPFSGWRLGRRPALDGIRALAVVAVVLHHTHVLQGAGDMGVDVFFALSGFLITSLLLEEYAELGRIRLLAFYRRRALRLVPALVVLVTVVVAAGLAFRAGSWWMDWPSAFGALGYVSNFMTMAGDVSALNHTWSLAIEEQFYLTWPLLLIVLAPLGRRAVVSGAAAITVATAVWTHHLVASGASYERFTFGLDTRTTPILAGCALAAWIHGRREGRPQIVLAYAALAGLLWLSYDAELLYGWRSAASAALSLVLVYAVVQGEGVETLQGRVLVWLGRRSYGIYLWHFPAAAYLNHAAPNMFVVLKFAIVLPLAIAAAAASYRFVEQPFLRIKDRGRAEAPRPPEGERGAGPAVSGGEVAQVDLDGVAVVQVSAEAQAADEQQHHRESLRDDAAGGRADRRSVTPVTDVVPAERRGQRPPGVHG